MTAFWRDLRYAARSLARTPGLVVVATLSLALGMGVNTSLFAAVKAVLFTDASGTARDRLVRARFGNAHSISYPNLQDIGSAGIFADVAGHELAVFSVRSHGEAERAMGELVTANYFDVLGVRAAIGRTFSAPDADPARNPAVVVLSHRYWQLHFENEGAVVGRAIAVNGQTCTVVGVLPEDFRSIEGFGLAPEMYVPISRALVQAYDERSGGATLRLLARLRPERTRAQTEDALAATIARLRRDFPRENEKLTPRGVQLFGVSAVERLREAGGMAPVVARALGAAPSLLLRKVLKSGLLLVGSGAALGLGLTFAVARALGSAIAGVRLDEPLILVAPALLVFAAGLAATWLPAHRATRVDPVKALRCE